MLARTIVSFVAATILTAVAMVCLLRDKSSGRPGNPDDASRDAPQAISGEALPASAGRTGADVSGAEEVRAARRAEAEARRREHEAFKAMSPEERRQFRERKRAEKLARHEARRGRKGSGRRRSADEPAEDGAGGNAAGTDAAAEQAGLGAAEPGRTSSSGSENPGTQSRGLDQN